MGNTCFLNSVLQCLTYTPPLANLCLERAHSAVCRAPNGCVFCLLEAHLRRALSGSAGSTLTPREFVANLRAIGRHFRAGRQEDSHEFLRYLVEALQRASLRGLPPEQLRASPRLAETSVVHSIFGGYLRSQVKCAACTYESNTFDPFLDLSLELEGQPSVPRALQAFTAPERLDAENQYRCERCRRLSRATKRLSIHRAPAVLTMQLKRFKAGPFGNFKISKFVEYPDRLSLAEYMSPQQERPPEPRADGPWYRLYAVLVHEGASTRSGHYYCFVKNSNGVWYMMNDDAVHQVSLATVLRQQAYVLFYIRESPLQSPSPPLSTTTATTATPSPAPRPALVSRLDPAAPSAKAKVSFVLLCLYRFMLLVTGGAGAGSAADELSRSE
jgi:ubiquitin carboxyl-terminal hydrolase 36/42